MKKKLLSMLILVALLCSLMPAAAFAAGGELPVDPENNLEEPEAPEAPEEPEEPAPEAPAPEEPEDPEAPAEDPEEELLEEHELEEENEGKNATPCNLKVGGKKYTVLEDALEAAEKGGNIVLQENTDDITIEPTKAITLDLNGYTLGNLDVSGETVTVIDRSIIGDDGWVLAYSGDVVLKAGYYSTDPSSDVAKGYTVYEVDNDYLVAPDFSVDSLSPTGEVDVTITNLYSENLCDAAEEYILEKLLDPEDDTFDNITPGARLYVQIVTKNLKMADAGSDYNMAKDYVADELGKGWGIGVLFDMSCVIRTDEKDSKVLFEMPYIGNEIELNVRIPSSIKASGRSYRMLGVHNTDYSKKTKGKTLTDFNPQSCNGNWITFQTDAFSTFAIAVKGGNFNIPATGDNSNMGLWIALMSVSAMTAAGYVFYRKKQGEI